MHAFHTDATGPAGPGDPVEIKLPSGMAVRVKIPDDKNAGDVLEIDVPRPFLDPKFRSKQAARMKVGGSSLCDDLRRCSGGDGTSSSSGARGLSVYARPSVDSRCRVPIAPLARVPQLEEQQQKKLASITEGGGAEGGDGGASKNSNTKGSSNNNGSNNKGKKKKKNKKK
jgi:hypothetical protein